MSRKPALVKSAARTLDVLELVVKHSKPPTFTNIQEILDIPKSSLSYLLQELMNRDYIEYDSDMRVYYPGIKLVQVSASCMNNTSTSKEISLGIKKLSEALGETTHAGVLDGRFIIYISKCQGIKDVSVVTNIGFRIPAHATAIGKVLLSALSTEDLETRYKDICFEKYTENTITSYTRLLDEIKEAAVKGYAIDDQEIIPGGICVAAPVYDRSNKMIVAISATMPAIRAKEQFLEEVIDKVKLTAENISMRIGKM